MIKPSIRPRQCQVPTCRQPAALVEPERPTKRAKKTVGFSFSEKSTRRHSLLSRYSSREVEVTSSSRSSTQTLTLEVTSTTPEVLNEDIKMDLCETLGQLSTIKAKYVAGTLPDQQQSMPRQQRDTVSTHEVIYVRRTTPASAPSYPSMMF